VAVRLGDAAFEADDFERAIRDYRLYLSDVDRGEYTARAFYKSALSAYRLEDYAGTLATLDELQQRYPGGSWVQVDALRGDALRELGKPGDAVLAWDDAWGDANDIERPKLRARIAGVVAGLPPSELDELRGEVRSRGVRDIVAYEIAARTPPKIDEPVPPVVANAPVEVEAPAAEVAAPGAPVVDSKDVQAPAVEAAVEAEAPVAEAPIAEVDSEPVPLPQEAAAAQAEAVESEENVARLVRTERPLDPGSAAIESEPAPEPAPDAGSAPGVARLQRIAFPGAVDATPPVDSLEKLDVPAEAGTNP
jgi:tetratricopeptide (TPR) repeat protein